MPSRTYQKTHSDTTLSGHFRPVRLRAKAYGPNSSGNWRSTAGDWMKALLWGRDHASEMDVQRKMGSLKRNPDPWRHCLAVISSRDLNRMDTLGQ